ncbi:HAD family hydrolase [Williamsia sp. Leaf354]|uniref:HAD family hydrolase n=1 Tax=Williamsia sp. Leaf354 TaxID=1736349 RepID=UPI0006FC17D0|nr:HAD family hydrolase [Williamsia sp. Leaf354]KQR99550.1 HAD family hydrolase [Williamsia sp. Leaf354]
MSEPRAALFDIDGTLVDSVYTHVAAWREAFAESDLTVPHWEIHRRIGKDGALLVSELIEVSTGDAGSDDLESRLSDAHDRAYAERSSQLTVLPGARELVREAKRLGMRVVLATSAPDHELAVLRELLGVDDLVDAITSGADVDTAKPDSTIVGIALDRAGVRAADAVMIGDATWDFVAASDRGVPGIGVLTGGVGRGELLQAGAGAVYRDAAEVVASGILGSGDRR